MKITEEIIRIFGSWTKLKISLHVFEGKPVYFRKKEIWFNFLFKKENKTKPSNRFSHFFLETSSKEKKKIITEAARRANEDQRRLFYDKTYQTTKPAH